MESENSVSPPTQNEESSPPAVKILLKQKFKNPNKNAGDQNKAFIYRARGDTAEARKKNTKDVPLEQYFTSTYPIKRH